MITVEEARAYMKAYAVSFGNEQLPLGAVTGRVLAETIHADRNFPPFNRAAMDGIAIRHAAYASGIRRFPIEGIQGAGEPRKQLLNDAACLEIMTGAPVPEHADTIVPYEQLDVQEGVATLHTVQVRQLQHIHVEATDARAEDILLQPPLKLHAGHVNTLATVGKATVAVARLPKVAVISTGDELVGVHEKPELHQIRASNVHALKSLLREDGIQADAFHLQDQTGLMRQKLEELLQKYDVLLLSGGVSKGKYDYVPDCLQELGVEKVFHGIKQKPGKPFWFGVQGARRIFALPGNPVSAFTCYLLYFRLWLGHSQQYPQSEMLLKNTTGEGLSHFWHHRLVWLRWLGELQQWEVTGINTSGSGDLIGLNKANGILSVPPTPLSAQLSYFTPFASVGS